MHGLRKVRGNASPLRRPRSSDRHPPSARLARSLLRVRASAAETPFPSDRRPGPQPGPKERAPRPHGGAFASVVGQELRQLAAAGAGGSRVLELGSGLRRDGVACVQRVRSYTARHAAPAALNRLRPGAESGVGCWQTMWMKFSMIKPSVPTPVLGESSAYPGRAVAPQSCLVPRREAQSVGGESRWNGTCIWSRRSPWRRPSTLSGRHNGKRENGDEGVS
jgi:hypothetical protein